MGYITLLLGLAFLVSGVLAFVANRRAYRSGAVSLPVWKRMYQWRWLAMVVVGLGVNYFSYPMTGSGGEHYRVIGFPFMAAAFDSNGADYVSSMTPWFFGLDVVTCAFVPDLCLWAWRSFARAPKGASDA